MEEVVGIFVGFVDLVLEQFEAVFVGNVAYINCGPGIIDNLIFNYIIIAQTTFVAASVVVGGVVGCVLV